MHSKILEFEKLAQRCDKLLVGYCTDLRAIDLFDLDEIECEGKQFYKGATMLKMLLKLSTQCSKKSCYCQNDGM